MRGGLPPACLDAAYPVEWFRGYIQTYVERDLRQLSQITDLVAFRVLAQLAALRTLDDFLVRWAQRKYKRLRTHKRRAWKWLWRIHAQQPSLFAHWALVSTVGR